MENVTQILHQVEAGDAGAAAKLLPLVYDELRRLAARQMAVEKAGHTLQPTALVHEAWLRLAGDASSQQWNSRGHFYAAAAEAMRRILIESARRKASLKRGGELNRVELPFEAIATSPENDWAGLLSLDEALTKLRDVDFDCYQLVMLRFFSGLTVEEAARSLDVSSRTAKRNWNYARAWLQREIDSEPADPPS
ncbi:MAG: sigma-70 family RNA polymerase sigma factor [Planctomycetaceae bacterium]